VSSSLRGKTLTKILLLFRRIKMFDDFDIKCQLDESEDIDYFSIWEDVYDEQEDPEEEWR
jgi:hypothetical protein